MNRNNSRAENPPDEPRICDGCVNVNNDAFWPSCNQFSADWFDPHGGCVNYVSEVIYNHDRLTQETLTAEADAKLQAQVLKSLWERLAWLKREVAETQTAYSRQHVKAGESSSHYARLVRRDFGFDRCEEDE